MTWAALVGMVWFGVMLAVFLGCLWQWDWPPSREGEPMQEGQQVDYGFLGLVLTLLALYVAKGMLE